MGLFGIDRNQSHDNMQIPKLYARLLPQYFDCRDHRRRPSGQERLQVTY